MDSMHGKRFLLVMETNKHQWKMAVMQWRSHVVDLVNDLDDILAARGREVSAVPAHQFE